LGKANELEPYQKLKTDKRRGVIQKMQRQRIVGEEKASSGIKVWKKKKKRERGMRMKTGK